MRIWALQACVNAESANLSLILLDWAQLWARGGTSKVAYVYDTVLIMCDTFCFTSDQPQE